MSTSQHDLNSLFADSGLDDDAVEALTLTADDLGPAIMAGLGDIDVTAINDMQANEVTLVKLVADDSSSIEMAGNTDIVIEGHNTILDALAESKAAGVILVSCTFFNGGVLYPFVPLERAVRLTRNNYCPYGGTPLYDVTAVELAGVVAKMSQLENGGVTVRAVTDLVSDGADTTSQIHRLPNTVAPIVQGLLRTESHIVGGMGISDGSTDFRAVYQSMGLRDRWILTPGNTRSEIRRAFGTMSKSTVRASQAAGSFSQTAMGGFGIN